MAKKTGINILDAAAFLALDDDGRHKWLNAHKGDMPAMGMMLMKVAVMAKANHESVQVYAGQVDELQGKLSELQSGEEKKSRKRERFGLRLRSLRDKYQEARRLLRQSREREAYLKNIVNDLEKDNESLRAENDALISALNRSKDLRLALEDFHEAELRLSALGVPGSSQD